MGSGQSARKLTVTNEEEIGVIKVSNSLVQRIAQREKEKASESSLNAVPTTPDQHPTPPPPSAMTVPPAASNGHPASGHPVYYYPELTMSAHQIYQQKEQELKQQEQYWHRRLQNVDDSYQKINRILAEEYQKTTAETSAKAGECQCCLIISESSDILSRWLIDYINLIMLIYLCCFCRARLNTIICNKYIDVGNVYSCLNIAT